MRWLRLTVLSVGLLGCRVPDEASTGADVGGGEAGPAGGEDDDADGDDDDDTGGAGTTTGGIPGGRYHPPGFGLAQNHGLAAKLGMDDCRECHGTTLKGTSEAEGCDGCHQQGWRTDCLFCHGGDETILGAPPRDIDGTTGLEDLTFRAHTAHVTDGIHAAFDCTHCHVKPTNVLSPGHVFDDTPGTAEVVFANGLSPLGTYTDGTCANLYCHGDANGTLGVQVHTDPAPTCGGCHGDAGTPNAWATMSGQHRRHLGEGLDCSECHGATAGPGEAIVQPLLHVNGHVETAFTGTGVTYSGTNCTGACHGKLHFAQSW